jgi:hypothetical protein
MHFKIKGVYAPMCQNTIFQLEKDEGIIVGEDNLKVCITNYYKNLTIPKTTAGPPCMGTGEARIVYGEKCV